MIKLIIFDFDGTLIDSKKANLAVARFTLKHFNQMYKGKDMSLWHKLATKESIKSFFPIFKRKRAFKFIQNHRKDFFHLMRLNKNVMYILKYLKKKKYKMAIATNRAKTTYDLVEQFKLGKYFDFIATAGMIRKHKPWPHQINYVIRKMNKIMRKGRGKKKRVGKNKKKEIKVKIRKDEVLYIGDSFTDSIAAHRAKVKCVIYKNNRLKADYHIMNFKKLKKILKELDK